MKRYIAVFTAVFLLAAGFPAAAETGTGHWASDMMEDLRQNGVIQGDESGSLNPDSAITRAEFVTVVNRVFQISGTTGENFRDVPPDAWYAEEMLAAKANGYLSGDGVGLAHPEREITRAETCVILARVMKLHTAEESLSFTDGDAIPAWAVGEISALVKGGFVSGYPDGSFHTLYLYQIKTGASGCHTRTNGNANAALGEHFDRQRFLRRRSFRQRFLRRG